MTILKLYDDISANADESKSQTNEETQKINSCSKLSIWKSIGLRFAFLLASLFCIMWFVWSCIAYIGRASRLLLFFKTRFAPIGIKTRYKKSFRFTAISFLGCAIAAFSPYIGLSFLSTYFGIFANDFSKEGIQLDELIATVKKLSA